MWAVRPKPRTARRGRRSGGAVVEPLKTHSLLLNYLEAREQYSSGVVEGLNNKVTLKTRLRFSHRRRPEVAL